PHLAYHLPNPRRAEFLDMLALDRDELARLSPHDHVSTVLPGTGGRAVPGRVRLWEQVPGEIGAEVLEFLGGQRLNWQHRQPPASGQRMPRRLSPLGALVASDSQQMSLAEVQEASELGDDRSSRAGPAPFPSADRLLPDRAQPQGQLRLLPAALLPGLPYQ